MGSKCLGPLAARHARLLPIVAAALSSPAIAHGRQVVAGPTGSPAGNTLLLAPSAGEQAVGQADAHAVGKVLAHRFADKGWRVVPLEGAELRLGLRRATALLELREARRLASEGALLVGHLELQGAVQRLRQSLQHFARAQLLPETCREAAKAKVDLAYALWQLGRLDEAAAWMPRRQTPGEAAIDARAYSPPFLAAMRRHHRPAATPLVSVISTPEGAELWRDCEQVGNTPASLSLPGATLIALALADHTTWGRSVSPATSGSVIEVKLEPRSALDETPAEVLQRLLVLRQASSLAVWRQTRGRAAEQPRADLAIEVSRFERGSWTRWRPTDAVPRAEAEAWAAGLDSAERQGSGRPSRWRVASRWALLGLGAAALVAGTTCGFIAHSAGKDVSRAAASHALYDSSLASSYDRHAAYRTAAYALWGVGAAALVTAAVLWLTEGTGGGKTSSYRR